MRYKSILWVSALLEASILLSCGSSASFHDKTSVRDGTRGAGDGAGLPSGSQQDNDSQHAALPNVSAPGETSFDLKVVNHSDSARVTEPIDFIISLDTSNSMTRHADELAAALGPFLSSIDALGMRMDIRLVALDEYQALLQPQNTLGVLAPAWFFGNGAEPSLTQAFPSGRVFHSNVKAEVQALSDLIRAKARQSSQISSETMYCGLETFLSLMQAQPGFAAHDRHVLTVTDSDNDWLFKTYDLAGKLTAQKSLACNQVRDASVDQVPYQYDVDKHWQAYAYNEVTPASVSYRYDAVIKTVGDCQSRFNDPSPSIDRFNLYSNDRAEKETNTYSCVDSRTPATYACQNNSGWSATGATKYDNNQYQSCDAYALATCSYVVDEVPTVEENIPVDRARTLASQGATCVVKGSPQRGVFAKSSSSGILGYANCAMDIACSVASYKAVDVTDTSPSYLSACQLKSSAKSNRPLVSAIFSGNNITGFSTGALANGETSLSSKGSLSNVSGPVCANALPATLPNNVYKEAASASVNGQRNQQVVSATKLNTADQVAALLKIAAGDLISYRETVVNTAAKTTPFSSTYQLNPVPANASFVSQVDMRQAEATANQTLAGYRYNRAADVESIRIYRDGGRYTDADLKNKVDHAWLPLGLASVDDVVAQLTRSTFHTLTKMDNDQSTCQGNMGSAHIDLAKKTGGAAWDICNSNPATLSDFFDKLLRKVVATVVREYRLDDMAPGATILEVRLAGAEAPLKVGVDYELVTLSDGSHGISFKKDVKAGDVYHITARLPASAAAK